MVPVDEGDLRKPLPPLPQELPLPLPLRPPKAFTEALSMPKVQHWLKAPAPVPKGEPKASTEGKSMSKPPEGMHPPKPVVPPNLVDAFSPHPRTKRPPMRHDGGIPDTGGSGYPEPKALKKGQPQAAKGEQHAPASSSQPHAAMPSHGRPQAATLSSVPEQEVAVPEPQTAARGFPLRTRVRDPASGEMIRVKRNPLHGLYDRDDSEGSPAEEVPAKEEPEEVPAEEEPEEAPAEEGPQWTPVEGPQLFRHRAGYLVNEKEKIK